MQRAAYQVTSILFPEVEELGEVRVQVKSSILFPEAENLNKFEFKFATVRGLQVFY